MWSRVLLVGLLGLGLVPILSAQRGPGGGPQGQGGFGGNEGGFGAGGFGGPGGRPYQANRLEQFTDLLKLNKEQKNALKEIFNAAQKEAAPLREDIQKSRAAIAAAYFEKKDQQTIDQMLAQHGTLMAQMANVEMQAFAKLVAQLTPDQQKRAGRVFQQMSGIFSGSDWNRTGH